MANQPKVCVIGAGCSGITSVKNLIQAGIRDVVCYEKNDQIGGNWVYSAKESHSSVCETTHIISSKKMSEFVDFPMPDHYPDYPSHQQVLAYFQDYVRHFQLSPYIRFNTAVKKVEKQSGGRWAVTTEHGESTIFDYVLIANGHHSVPRMPDIPGTFTGQLIHSHSYKTNTPFKGQRVLVIGAGNSGCDCAVEISRVAEKTAISMRRPYYIIPKFLMGRPTDTFNKILTKIPKGLRSILQRFSLKLQIGDYRDYGLERPDYPLTGCHPTLNSELLYRLRHGKVHPRKGVTRFDGQQVHFADGTTEEFDTVIAATGYKITFPFFDKSLIDYEDADRIPMYLRMFQPEHERLIFIGLFQPQGCIWPLADLQAKLAGNYIMGRWQRPANIAMLAEKDADYIAREFLFSKRHTIEVHYHPFQQALLRQIPSTAPEWKDTAVVV
jgi:hypothetical protein